MGEIALRQALEEYASIHLPSRNFAQRTRVEYRNDVEDLIRYLEGVGKQNVLEITIRELEGYLAELDRRNIAGSTRKRKVISIRSFLSFLYQFDYTGINLGKRLIPPYAEPKKARFLTESEYRRLLACAAHNIRDFAIIQLLLQTGIKLSELTQLMISDIDLPAHSHQDVEDTGTMVIRRTERNKERNVPLNDQASRALLSDLKSRSAKKNPVLFLNASGESLSPRGVEKVVQKYYEQAGIEGATVQSLRHTFGVHHIVRGTSLKTIQKMMGHKDIRSTLIYKSLAQDLNEIEI